jgi:hypothetical protein
VKKEAAELNGELRRQFCVKAKKKSKVLCLKVEDLASIEEVFPLFYEEFFFNSY